MNVKQVRSPMISYLIVKRVGSNVHHISCYPSFILISCSWAASSFPVQSAGFPNTQDVTTARDSQAKLLQLLAPATTNQLRGFSPRANYTD
jgi:hypothetical protein